MSTQDRKRGRQDGSTQSEDGLETTIEVSLLESINAKLSVLELLRDDIRELKASLQFSQSQIDTLVQENSELKETVKALSAQVKHLTDESKVTEATLLDIQCRSMRENLIFSGIPRQNPDNPEQILKQFMETSLQLSKDTVEQITFHRVHRIPPPKNQPNLPPPIIAKFEHYKQKELIKSKGKLLKGTAFGMNDQFPKEINRRRKLLVPIMKDFRAKGQHATISVDKLYVEGELYRDRKIMTWLREPTDNP